jgi:magnesium chelatase family protein
MAVVVVGAALQGVDAVPVQVEVDLLRRLPKIAIVGLPANAVKESADRVRSALAASGFEFPRKRVVINLAPADLRKEGTGLELPMALGILAADGLIPVEPLVGILAVGELSLSGELRPVRGALAMATLARDRDLTLVIARADAPQARVVPGVRVIAADHLEEVVHWLATGEEPPPGEIQPRKLACAVELDLADVRGQAHARRALEIAAAGAHHLLLVGPPGCGKTMLAQRLPSLLPPMAFDEALTTTRIWSAAGLLQGIGILEVRPFRAPHHSVTAAGLIGDRTLRPGELSLAHNGVLFLDEAAEFARSVLDVLRQPLEEGVVRVTRAAGAVEYPAGITLVLACNPCPCGNYGSTTACKCAASDVYRYQRRLSGPILDRIDLHVHMEAVPAGLILGGERGEPSATVRGRVVRAREVRLARGQVPPNSQLPSADLERWAPLDRDGRAVLEAAANCYHLSGRGTRRVLKVARTIADLEGSNKVRAPHVSEALLFRAVVGTP